MSPRRRSRTPVALPGRTRAGPVLGVDGGDETGHRVVQMPAGRVEPECAELIVADIHGEKRACRAVEIIFAVRPGGREQTRFCAGGVGAGFTNSRGSGPEIQIFQYGLCHQSVQRVVVQRRPPAIRKDPACFNR